MRTTNVELNGNGTGPAGTAPGRYVRLTVSDTGCGMTEDVAARAFDPFFTTKPVGEGTGLGLATVYGIIKQAGGDLALDSRAGAGTTVTLYLPATEAPALPRTQRTPSRPAPADGQVVLVVEDETAVRRLISRVLSRNGYVVEEAASSPEALGACANPDRRLDLVLTDVVMPTMSGGELAEHARRIRPNLNVLFMSGHPDDVRLRNGIPAGQPYLQKPFTSGELLNHVAATLRAEPHRRRRAGGLCEGRPSTAKGVL
jgi:two-component system, cell cycle sensor histidine kinase and response regulator CckA